jgi:hypothetical protein
MFHWTREQAAQKAKAKPKAPAEPATALTWRDRERMKRESNVHRSLNDESAFPTLGGKPVAATGNKMATNSWGQLAVDDSSDDEEEAAKEKEEVWFASTTCFLLQMLAPLFVIAPVTFGR